MSQPEWVKNQKLIFSQLWKLQVWKQGVSSADSFQGPWGEGLFQVSVLSRQNLFNLGELHLLSQSPWLSGLCPSHKPAPPPGRPFLLPFPQSWQQELLCLMSESPSGKREGFQDNATRKKGEVYCWLESGLPPRVQCSGTGSESTELKLLPNL